MYKLNTLVAVSATLFLSPLLGALARGAEAAAPGAGPAAAPGEIIIDPTQPWNDTHQPLVKGRQYKITVRAGVDDAGLAYADQDQPCTPEGLKRPRTFKGWLMDTFGRDARCPLNPAHWMKHGKIPCLRVLQDGEGHRATFLTVIGCIGKDDRAANTFVIGSGRTITAPADGPLVVFSNDWPGGTGTGDKDRFDGSVTYPNNRGRLFLTIEPVEPAAGISR